jgi:hypothetical protein
MTDNDDINYFLIIILFIFLIIFFYLFFKNNKIEIENDVSYKNYNNYSSKIINNVEDDYISNPGYINELIKLPINKNDNECDYVKQFNKINDVVPTDNIISFCPLSKKEKTDLPYANINVNCL